MNFITMFSQIESLECRRLFSFGQQLGGFNAKGITLPPDGDFVLAPTQERTDASGRILVESADGIVRYTAAGNVDKSFGTQGIASAGGNDFVFDSSHRIVVVGYGDGFDGSYVKRLNSDGSIDRTLGVKGAADFISGSLFIPRAIAIDGAADSSSREKHVKMPRQHHSRRNCFV